MSKRRKEPKLKVSISQIQRGADQRVAAVERIADKHSADFQRILNVQQQYFANQLQMIDTIIQKLKIDEQDGDAKYCFCFMALLLIQLFTLFFVIPK